MSEWILMIVREVVMLAILAALGAGFAAALPAGRLTGSRVALSLPLGLAAGICITTTASWLLPMDVAAWVLLAPACVASAVIAWRRVRIPWRVHLPWLGGVAAVLALGYTWPLASERRVGPLGYYIGDAFGYVSEIVGLKDNRLYADTWGPPWDRLLASGNGFAHGFQQIGYDTFLAAVTSPFGWAVSDTQSAGMAVLVIVGAFGIYALVSALTDVRWCAAVAGLLYGGPLAYQLFMESSEGALAGLALVPLVALLTIRLLAAWSLRDVLLLGLALAGLQTAYPLLVPPVAVAGAVILAYRLLLAVRRRTDVKRGALTTGALIVLAAVLTPVAFARNAEYWIKVATTDYLKTTQAAGLPVYDLPFQVLPSWILQTREFYFLPRSVGSSLQQWLLAYVIPVALIGLIAFGVARYRRAWVLLPLAAAAAIAGYYSYRLDSCSYCLQRNLLIIGPAAAALLGVGLAAVWSFGGRAPRYLAVGGAVVLLGLVGHKGSVMARRAHDGGYANAPQLHTVVDALDGRRGTLELEGINLTSVAPLETPGIYGLVDERTPMRLSLPAEVDEFNGLTYLGGKVPAALTYDPHYRWVLTRLASISTPRRTVARDGAFALQERTRPLDVTVVGGVAAGQIETDPDGGAWVLGPMQFWVSAPASAGPVAVKLRFETHPGLPVKVTQPAGARVQRSGDGLELCVEAQGTGELRRAGATLSFQGDPVTPPPTSLGIRSDPGRAVRLAAMEAVEGRCAP